MSDIKELIANELRPIGDAIREKTERAILMNTKQMAEEIKNFQTDEDAKLFIKATLDPTNNQLQDFIIPSYVKTITARKLFNFADFQNFTISEGVEEIPVDFLTDSNIRGELYIPSTIKKWFSSGALNLLFSATVYFNGTVEKYFQIIKDSNDSRLAYFLFSVHVSQWRKPCYFKNSSDAWFDVKNYQEIITLTDAINSKNALSYSPFEFNFDSVSEIYTSNNYGYCYSETYFIDDRKNVTLNSNITKLNSQSFGRGFINILSINTNAISTDFSISPFDGTRINKIKIGDNVTGLGKYAFRDFYLMQSNQITIPASVTSIGAYGLYVSAVEPAPKLAILKFLSKTPCSIQTNSFNTSKLSKIYVPKGSASVYKIATNWSTYADYIFEPNTVSVSIPDTLLNNENYTYSIDGDDFQQFTASSLALENIATFKIKNSGDVTINVGTTNGGTEIGSVGTGAELLYATESDTTIYLTVA